MTTLCGSLLTTAATYLIQTLWAVTRPTIILFNKMVYMQNLRVMLMAPMTLRFR
jgi:hypothetical protein